MKLYLFVSVQKNGKLIVKESATSIELPDTLVDLFLAATSFPELPPINIQVCFQAHGSLQWHDTKMGIEEDLELLAYLCCASNDDRCQLTADAPQMSIDI